ncbi:MAG: YggS family pyridoxal phosphate-dependent enzyme [Planctomycetota bacterium]
MEGLGKRLARVRSRIDAALRRAGDAGRRVVIIGVTKNAPAPTVDALAGHGIRDIGENRVQEALAKASRVSARVRWHLIGHLQRNKVHKAVTLFGTIHSVDSVRLVEALAATRAPLEVFLQVNVSGEATKHGAAPGDLAAVHRAALAAPDLRVAGLMGMAAAAGDPEAARPAFRRLRELLEERNRAGDGPPLRSLSMGMSDDFEVAVEEGATHLRLGRALTAPPRA